MSYWTAVALVCALFDLAVIVAAIVLAAIAFRKAAPLLRPYLAMLRPPPADARDDRELSAAEYVEKYKALGAKPDGPPIDASN